MNLLDKLKNADKEAWNKVEQQSDTYTNSNSTIKIETGPASGLFSKELLNQITIKGKRNKVTITDVFISKESLESLRTWEESPMDEKTKKEIFAEGKKTKVWSISFHKLPDHLDQNLIYAFDSTSEDGLLDSLVVGQV